MGDAHPHRTLQRIVEDQVLRWEARPPADRQEPRRPVVAVSRQEGTYGEAAARALARDLGLDFFDSEIVHLMAEKAHIRERVIRSLDERGQGFIEDMWTHLVNRYGITSDVYFDLLAKTIGTIGWHGNAVIVGRGAAHILRRPENLTVRFVAPLRTRVEILCSELGMEPKQARDRIVESDRERQEFLHRYFRSTIEAEEFDLVIDNRFVGLDASVEILKAAVLARTGDAGRTSAAAATAAEGGADDLE